MSKVNLRVVRNEPARALGPADILAEVVPELIAAEALVARLRNIMADQGRMLARERGVAFIRPESLRQEFKGARHG